MTTPPSSSSSCWLVGRSGHEEEESGGGEEGEGGEGVRKAWWRFFQEEEEEEEEEADASDLFVAVVDSGSVLRAMLVSPGDVPLRTVFPSVSGRLVMHGIMAGMDQKGFFMFVDIPFVPQSQILMVETLQQTTEFPQLLYVSGGRCPCCAGRVCHAALVSTTVVCAQGWLCWFRCASAVFLLVVAGRDLQHLGRYDQKDSCCGMYKAGIAGGHCTLRCVRFPGSQALSWTLWSRQYRILWSLHRCSSGTMLCSCPLLYKDTPLVQTVPKPVEFHRFTVPLNGWTIAATATVVTLVLFVGSLLRGCLRCDVMWWWFFTPDGSYDSVWDSATTTKHDGSRTDHISGLAQFQLSAQRVPCWVLAPTRAAERRDGPVRVRAPLLKRTEEGQGWGGGAQGQVRGATATEAPSSPGFPATLSG